jgi:lipopolysaccharide transport system permease protein
MDERKKSVYLKPIWAIVENRELIWEMALRDLKGGSKGAILGILWVAINPLIQVIAYVAIVSFIFKAKLSSDSGPFDYALYVLSGMIPWQIMVRSINEAPMLIRSNTELVKQVIYPIETLPINNLLVGSFGGLINFVVFLSLFFISGNGSWTVVLLPIPLLFLFLFILGMSWIFSISGVILKDLKEIVTIIMGLLVYFSPVIVSDSMVGESIWRWILLNPLSHIIISFRDIFGGTFHFWSWVIFLGMSIVIFICGELFITKAKRLINEYI